MTNEILYNEAASPTNWVTTELNALASAGVKLGTTVLNNSTGLKTFMDIEVSLAAQGSARSAGANIQITLLISVDGGTTYPYGADSLAGSPSAPQVVVGFDAATNARVATATMIPIPPAHIKPLVHNNTGQALGATGNTIRVRTYALEVQDAP